MRRCLIAMGILGLVLGAVWALVAAQIPLQGLTRPLPGLIDQDEPINLSWRLNRGLIGWWSAAPWLAGSNTWWSLTNRYPATLNGITSGFGWMPDLSGRHSGCVQFGGTDNGFIAGFLGQPASMTIEVVAESTDNGDDRWLVSPGEIVSVWLAWPNSQLNARYLYSGTPSYLTLSGSPTWYGTGIHQFVVVVDPTKPRHALYGDGTLLAQDAAQTGAIQWGYAPNLPSTDTYFARNGAADASHLIGRICNVRIWERGLSDDEVAELYQDTMVNGYRLAFKRLDPQRVLGTTAGGFLPFFH